MSDSSQTKPKQTETILRIVIIVAVAILALWLFSSIASPAVKTITSKDSECYSAEAAEDYKGENGCVNFNVGYTYESSSGNKFIDQYEDYETGFIVYIPYNSPASKLSLDQFEGKNIKVSGDITDYYGATEIIVTEASQITIYE